MNAIAPAADLIERLSDAEQRTLYDRLAFKFSKKSKPFEEVEETFFSIIQEITKTKMTLDQFVLMKGTSGRSGYCTKVAETVALLEAGSGGQLRRVARDGLLRLALRSLAEDLRARGIPATPATMVTSNYMRNAIERRFPGYIDAGLLHRVIAPLT